MQLRSKKKPEGRLLLEAKGKLSLSRVAIAFLVLSFLVQLFSGFGLAFSVTAHAAPIAAKNISTNYAYADPAIKPDNKHNRDKSDVKTVSGVEQWQQLQQQFQQLQQQLHSDKLVPMQPTASNWLSQVAGKSTTNTAATNATPHNVPQFANIYWAKKTSDDSGTNPGDCTAAGNSDCSVRAAVNLTIIDNHGSSPDLVLISPGSSYFFNNPLTVPTNVYLTNSILLNCPSGNTGVTTFDFSGSSDGLTLIGNDYISNLYLTNSNRNDLVVVGSHNQVTCSVVVNAKNDGILISQGASDNQIGGVSPSNQFLGRPLEVLIGANANNGIEITGTNTTNNVVEDSGIGYELDLSIGFNKNGIVIGGGASNNQIGGNGTAQRNLISGNTNVQIDVTDAGTNNNKIYNNYIGTDENGNLISYSYIKTASGILVENGASGTVIGGERSQNYGNSIAATSFNVYLDGDANSKIQGNLIDVSPAFTGTLNSGNIGVVLSADSLNAIIGGEEDSTAHLGNVIDGNQAGIYFFGFSGLTATNASIFGNYIGTDPKGDAYPNQFGIVASQLNGLTVGSSGAGLGNNISANSFSGIFVAGTYTNTTNITIQNNTVGVKPDHSGPLYNGTSTGTNTGATVCNPGGTNDFVSESCDGIMVISSRLQNSNGYSSGPIVQIISNTIAANDTYSQNNGAGGAAGIKLDYDSGSTIQGNSIGAYVNGSTVISYPTNIDIALFNGSSNNQIGGDRSQGQGNLLASSIFDSLYVYTGAFNNNGTVYGPTNGNKIQGNAIGVDWNGNYNANLTSIGGYNGSSYGVDIDSTIITQSVNNNIIGVDFSVTSPNLNLGNLIGTQVIGVSFFAPYNTNDSNQINGNYIGVNTTTNSANAGNSKGIDLDKDLTNTKIEANYIGQSGIVDTTYGLLLENSITNTTVISNYIGTNASGANFGTSYNLWLDDSDRANTSGATQTLIKNNTIAYGTYDGIRVGYAVADPAATQRNTISQNSIYGNGGLGINLNYITNTNGVSGGSDTGPNNQAQAPTIVSATMGVNTGLKVTGTANPNSIVEVFLADSPSITNAQGKLYLATGNADNSGNFSLSASLPNGFSIPTSPYLVATSTLNDATHAIRVGSTSQFSVPFKATVLNDASYTYYLPFVANSAFFNFTTYLAFQNNSSSTATFTIQYFDALGNSVATPSGTCTSLAAFAECIAPNPFSTGSQGTGIITSNQPLNVVVAEATPYGGSAYAVAQGASNNQIAPVIIRGGLSDFTTKLTIFNGGNSQVSGTIQFYQRDGTLISAATKNFTINADTSLSDDQAIDPGLGSNFYGWAQITSPSGSQLVAQVLEQSPSQHFVALANAQATAQSTLYAPAIFHNAYGAFNTGVNIVNPNSQAVTVTVTYYNKDGSTYTAPSFSLTAHGLQGIYQGGASDIGLPSGGLIDQFAGAAIVSSTGSGVVMAVNEFGGVTANGNAKSGTYSASASSSDSVGLPVIANGGFGYTTGTTIFNTSGQTISGSIQYYNTDGSTQGTAKAFSVGAHQSLPLFQGDSSQGLPGGSSGFYGTAVVTESGGGKDLIITTNAASSAFFYSYTEPNS